MCRWFAYISGREPCLLEDALMRPEHSIVNQVSQHYLPGLFEADKEPDTGKLLNEPQPADKNKVRTTKERREELRERNLYFNGDGTGVAYYSYVAEDFGQANSVMPHIYKTITPPTNDINFKSLCKNTASQTVFAHVRMATSQVQQYNSHPFAFGRHIFMHNGSVSRFDEIRRDLCSKLSTAAYKNVQGTTDSEHIAALYMTHLVKKGKNTEGDEEKRWQLEYTLQEMKQALEEAIADVIALQRKLPGATNPLKASSLNLCTTDGSKLLAFRFRNSHIEVPPSLYYSTVAGVALNRKYIWHPDFLVDEDPGEFSAGRVGDAALPADKHGNHVIVSSEPTTRDTTQGKWKLVGKNEAVMVEFIGDDLETSLTFEKINVAY